MTFNGKVVDLTKPLCCPEEYIPEETKPTLSNPVSSAQLDCPEASMSQQYLLQMMKQMNETMQTLAGMVTAVAIPHAMAANVSTMCVYLLPI